MPINRTMVAITTALVLLTAFFGLPSTAKAQEIYNDGCSDAGGGVGDINILSARYNATLDEIVVDIERCDSRSLNTVGGWEVFMDLDAPFYFDITNDRDGDGVPDDDPCESTHEKSSSHDWLPFGRRGVSLSEAGPGTWSESAETLTLTVPRSELVSEPGELPPDVGDTIYLWARSSAGGRGVPVQRDLAPNTFTDDGFDDCEVPEVSGEVIALQLEADAGKIVFVTSSTHSGSLGGLAGADAICTARAGEAGLPGTYTAWLSDDFNDAKDRISQTGPWFRLNDGAKVADDVDDIVDCTNPKCLQATVVYNEDGVLANSGPNGVWTGTTAAGLRHVEPSSVPPFGRNCGNWTNTGFFLGFGGIWGTQGGSMPPPPVFFGMGGEWTFANAFGASCTTQALRLYCFQD